jgi:hypothetical protein
MERAGQMDTQTLKTLAEVAGIGGIALGILLLVFRDIIRTKVFAQLSKVQSYRLLRLVTVLTWSVAVLGVIGWVWSGSLTRLSEGGTGGVTATEGVAAGHDVNANDIKIESGSPKPGQEGGGGNITANGGVAAGHDVSAGSISITPGSQKDGQGQGSN